MHARELEPSAHENRTRRARWTPVVIALTCVAATQIARTDEPLHSALDHLRRMAALSAPEHDRFRARLDALETAPVTNDQASRELESLRRGVLLNHPLLRETPLLFVVRRQYAPDHHNTATFFPSARNEYNNGQFTPGGALKAIDLAAGGAVRTLLSLPDGVIRDPEVSFDGRRVLFSMRTNHADSYHLYELDADGSGLRQLTFAADVDDLDPFYLPDGGIAFSSTREPKYCMCNRHIMANLFRMDADGANIHQIGKSTLFEGHGSLLPDGRILYDRWEYVDRNFGDAQALWTVNPDGTAHALYWGNNTASPGGVIDARAIPGPEAVLCVFGSCHDRPWGALAWVDRRRGMDGAEPVVRLWPENARRLIQAKGWQLFDAFKEVPLKYEDPFPLDDHYFLCSRMTGEGERMGIYLLDVFGNETLVHVEGPGCFDPRPLGPNPCPPPIPARRDFGNAAGRFLVQDVYRGTHMDGVERGTIRWLRVVESPEKRFWTEPTWNGQGIEGPAMNWHDFNNKRILGTVPVESDGSAWFEVPADRFVYFQLLDADGMMVQSMRSGTMAQSGETTSCVGCHEDRRTAPPHSAVPLAAARAPSRLDGWFGPAREFNYAAEVQPVFDRHCVRCHDTGKPAGEFLNLAGDRDLVFNASYNELWRKQFVEVPGAGPAETQPAYSWGSHRSRLIAAIRGGKCGVRLSAEEFSRLATWVDLNAPFYPTYASAYPTHLAGRSPLNDAQLARLEALTGVPVRQLAGHAQNRGPQVSFDRPELSPILAGVAER
ncbi:MAG: hypothetical protein KDM81_08250, partial [Verrucomicrobiae bacterium]|nr:hypothetical protein [Verrucomicrobiae bacterium]